MTGQIIDEDEHGNRFKRVGDSANPPTGLGGHIGIVKYFSGICLYSRFHHCSLI